MALVPLATARRQILEACHLLPPGPVPLAQALGCVTAVAVTATEDLPPFANTAMDGFALRAADTTDPPVRLAVIGTLAAGTAPHQAVGPGEAVRIMTGAPIPPGADAVVMVERTAPVDGGGVTIQVAASPGDNVRRAGEDLCAGDEVFASRTVLSAAHLGVLASLGHEHVEVHPRARVGVLSTGDELVEGPAPLRPGQIRDANRPTLLALAEQAGCVPVDLGCAPDEPAALETALDRGLSGCDALVTSGGVSVGDFDYVKEVLDRRSRATGGQMNWWQVAIRPAKPLAFGVVGGKPVFGLPGNPVSSLVSFELFARPALRKMMGHHQVFRPEAQALADEPLRRRPDGKLHLARVVASMGDDGRYHVRSAGGQASHLLAAMARANALALVPDGAGIEAGGTVPTILLDP